MKDVCGWWMPDVESHLIPFIEAQGGYQSMTRSLALSHVEEFDVAVDIGAHCGLWSRELAQRFGRLYAFEPVNAHRKCFKKNVRGNYRLYPVGLSDAAGVVTFDVDDANTGHSHIGEGDREIRVETLDSFELSGIDFMKIDVEGHEYFVLRGGEETIRSSRPVICMEQKNHSYMKCGQYEAKKLLESWGAKEVDRVRGDHIFEWK